jgi:hypothetical protein
MLLVNSAAVTPGGNVPFMAVPMTAVGTVAGVATMGQLRAAARASPQPL